MVRTAHRLMYHDDDDDDAVMVTTSTHTHSLNCCVSEITPPLN